MIEVLELLYERYKNLSKGTESEETILNMFDIMFDNVTTWPTDKTGRWIGYIQCLLINVEKVTTVDNERNFTRPIFHNYYEKKGIEIPKSVETKTERRMW